MKKEETINEQVLNLFLDSGCASFDIKISNPSKS